MTSSRQIAWCTFTGAMEMYEVGDGDTVSDMLQYVADALDLPENQVSLALGDQRLESPSGAGRRLSEIDIPSETHVSVVVLSPAATRLTTIGSGADIRIKDLDRFVMRARLDAGDDVGEARLLLESLLWLQKVCTALQNPMFHAMLRDAWVSQAQAFQQCFLQLRDGVYYRIADLAKTNNGECTVSMALADARFMGVVALVALELIRLVEEMGRDVIDLRRCDPQGLLRLVDSVNFNDFAQEFKLLELDSFLRPRVQARPRWF